MSTASAWADILLTLLRFELILIWGGREEGWFTWTCRVGVCLFWAFRRSGRELALLENPLCVSAGLVAIQAGDGYE